MLCFDFFFSPLDMAEYWRGLNWGCCHFVHRRFSSTVVKCEAYILNDDSILNVVILILHNACIKPTNLLRSRWLGHKCL